MQSKIFKNRNPSTPDEKIDQLVQAINDLTTKPSNQHRLRSNSNQNRNRSTSPNSNRRRRSSSPTKRRLPNHPNRYRSPSRSSNRSSSRQARQAARQAALQTALLSQPSRTADSPLLVTEIVPAHQAQLHETLALTLGSLSPTPKQIFTRAGDKSNQDLHSPTKIALKNQKNLQNSPILPSV
ncbi:hypothetical protein BDR26DRAFT_902570 [Obelidium mucronatum]|nr:hypothetical protein BDR26DRAFT_902570 [Obelidium mucronatum]